jgi:hypothetical protein
MWKIGRFRIATATDLVYCPNCTAIKLRRSRRKGILEKTLLKVLAVRPYRCDQCDERYFGVGLRREPLDQPQTLPSDTPHTLLG